MGIGAIAGIAGAAASIYGASQAGQDSGSGYMPYLPRYSTNADWLWLDALNSGWDLGTGVPKKTSPFLQQGLQYQNLDPSAYINAGNAAAAMYPGIAQANTNAANTLGGLANNAVDRSGAMWDAGQSLWNTAQDPQNALRDRTHQQLVESVRAGQNARGLTMTPYAAGLENQANSDFLMNWNDRQLGRQSLGLQGLGQANLGANQSNQLAGADLTAMLQFMNQAPQALMQGGYTPLGVGQNLGHYFNNAAGGYAQGVGQALSVPAALQGSIIPYLYAGQGASNNAFNQFNTNRAYDTNQMASGVQGAFQGANQFANSPAGQNTNNWLQGLFGMGGGGGYNVDTSGTNLFAGQVPQG